MTTISQTSNYTPAADSEQKKTGPMQELGKDVFLQLMVTQMRYQDPLNPQDNSAFLAQMAQFTALEQMQNLNNSMEKLLGMQPDVQSLAPVYLGLWVTAADTEGQIIEGTVTAVEFAGGKPQLVINNQKYALDSVLKVTAGGDTE